MRVVVWTVAFILTIAACGGAIYYLTHRPTNFDSQIWLAGEKVDFSSDVPRLRMANGLIRDGKLIGMSRTEVDSLLGPQTSTGYFRPDYAYVYWLGAERGFFSIDSEWLVLAVGPDGKVSQALIVRD
jgi:hypothetical protein